MNKIYIGGDSFCFDRHELHGWPGILASKLNLQLTGTAFPGRGFWRTRLDLIEYLKDEDNLENTDLFVFCHTHPDRMLSSTYARALIGMSESQGIPTPHNNKEMIEVYYKYLFQVDIHDWAMERWFSEINEMLSKKNVINLFSFRKSELISQKLNGHKLNESLYNRALLDGVSTNLDVDKERLNHFSINLNIKFANALGNYYINEIIPNLAQTKYFDIDI